MRTSYLGAICEEAGSFGIVFRDFPGCVSSGDTMDEVVAMGREALQGHIEVMVEHGDAVPEPTVHSLDDVATWLDDDGSTSWVTLAPMVVEVPAYPDTLVLPIKMDLVREIAERSRATADAITARQFVENAVRHELDRLKKSA